MGIEFVHHAGCKMGGEAGRLECVACWYDVVFFINTVVQQYSSYLQPMLHWKTYKSGESLELNNEVKTACWVKSYANTICLNHSTLATAECFLENR